MRLLRARSSSSAATMPANRPRLSTTGDATTKLAAGWFALLTCSGLGALVRSARATAARLPAPNGSPARRPWRQTSRYDVSRSVSRENRTPLRGTGKTDSHRGRGDWRAARAVAERAVPPTYPCAEPTRRCRCAPTRRATDSAARCASTAAVRRSRIAPMTCRLTIGTSAIATARIRRALSDAVDHRRSRSRARFSCRPPGRRGL